MSILQQAVQSAYQQEHEQRKPGTFGARLSLGPMPFGTAATVRLLPRLGHEDGVPYRTAWYISLPFAAGQVGSDGQDTDEPVSVRVTSGKTWGLSEYIITATQYAWNASEAEKDSVARPYYHRATHYYGCLVVNLPFVEQFAPESPIRVLGVTRQLQDQIVTTGINNVDTEYAVVDYDHGRDLVVRKQQQGVWPNYSSSTFSFRERPLTQAERDAIAKYGLPNLEAEIGEPYSEADLAMIKAMFHASLRGEPFDARAFGGKFKAFRSGPRGSDAPRVKMSVPAIDEETQALLDTIKARNTSV